MKIQKQEALILLMQLYENLCEESKNGLLDFGYRNADVIKKKGYKN